MIIVALLLAVADPATFWLDAKDLSASTDNVFVNPSSDLYANASVDTVVVYGNVHDLSERVATYDIKTSTWTFQPGYDFDDVGRVLANHKPRTWHTGETCFNWYDGSALCQRQHPADEAVGLSEPRIVAGPPIVRSGCPLINGYYVCDGVSHRAPWSRSQSIGGISGTQGVTEDAGSLYSDDTDTGIMHFKDSAWLVLNGTLLFPLPVFVPLTAKAAYTTSWLVWFFGVCFFFRLRDSRMTEPVQMQPAPDGLLDELMSKIFGRSWRTGIAGLAGAALTVVAALTAVDAPYTFKKIAPLLPNVVMSLGLMTAKDGKVSHTQIPKT